MYYIALLVLISLIGNYVLADVLKCTDVAIQRLCLDQDTCDQCLQAHLCCNWCYDQLYDGRRCNTKENLSGCSQNKLEFNADVGISIPKHGDKSFTDASSGEIIQIKPQFINIVLAKDIPQNFTFTYKPAKNYPLELYYLGDMSASMMAHLTVFKTIGADLPTNLTQLTKNYRLAFGSFLDKVGMPFYDTAPEKFNNPCFLIKGNCETAYLFKHRLNFTEDTKQFIEKVSSSNATANLDDVDGALDALLQILVCGKKIGWSEYSRKIILIPTDSFLHAAGDGLLAGAVLIPNNTCLLDDEGNHMSPLMYDFPSVEQIHTLLKEKKVNIIFAVKSESKLEFYHSLTRELLKDSSFVGKLEEDATNIIELITRGYYNFSRQLLFYINTTLNGNVDVKFFGDCHQSGVFNETSGCYNVEDKPVKFMVQLTLKGEPTKSNDIFYVEEKNINERITLNVTYTGLCSCPNYDGEKLSCVNGEFRCGKCICQEEWTGKLCDESCDNKDFSSCRSSKYEHICNRNGYCVCGKCSCNHPFEGEYCQYNCPTSIRDNQICSNQGRCVEGKCQCNPNFEGDDCSCSRSQSNCKLFKEMDLCSGNGNCVCNKCSCNTDFSGQYCEKKKGNNTLCEDYSTEIEEAISNGTTKVVKRAAKFEILIVNEETRKEFCKNADGCSSIIYQGSSRCNISYCYIKKDDTEVTCPVTKNCFRTAGFTAITIGLVVLSAIVLLGLLGIGMAKYRIYKIEKEEYRRFQTESKSFHEMNPIYKDPVTSYRNPLREKDD